MYQNKDTNKNAYYTYFDTQMFLGAKELLKSMPTFYNRIYFSSKYANALWTGDKEETFTNVTILTEKANIAQLRQIIKNNFLYIGDWDSIKFTDKEDYGFSFIAGNIKYILMPFEETPEGYIIRCYDVDTGDCYETTHNTDKRFFLDTSVKDNGEFVRTCDFNLEYMTDTNTKKERAPKKDGPELIVYDKKGTVALNMIVIMLLGVVGVSLVYLAYNVVSGGLYK